MKGNYVPHDQLNEKQRQLLTVSQEIGLDHMAAAWNAVVNRIQADESMKISIDELVTLQMNTGVQMIRRMVFHIIEFSIVRNLSYGTPLEIVETFCDTLREAVSLTAQEIKKGMN